MKTIAYQPVPAPVGDASWRGGRAVFLWAVVAAGLIAIGWSVLDVVRHPPGALWWVLVALTIAAAYFPIRMPGFPISVSLAETFTMTAALLFGPGPAALAVACDGLVISLRLTPANRTPIRVLFNLTGPALTMWLAASIMTLSMRSDPVTAWAVDPWMFTGATALFVCAYFLLNTALVAGAVAFGRDVPWLGVWREHFLPLWITYVLGGFVAALIVVAARDPHLGPSAMFALGLVALALAGLREVAQRLENRSKTLSDLRTYAAALRSTADAVFLLNPAGRITFINPAGEELTGWYSREVQGRMFTDIVRLEALDRGATESSQPADPERVILSRSGETRPVEETRATIRDEDGSVIGTIATLRDISARKTIESARRDAFRRERDARRAADEANRAKDEFLAIVSHELRTPAGAIAGWTRLLKTGQLDATQTEKALAALERNVRAQNTVLNDLLDVSRIVRGSLRLDRRRIDLAAILTEAIDTVHPARDAREIVLTTSIESPLVIDADPDRLRQVFWNLLANAVKFTPRGGRIEVEAHRLGDAVSVAVTDTGSGIDPAFLPFVFEAFRQADQSPTRQHGGLGLGLAIVRHLIEAHGGTVQATSAGVGSGSRFTVTLPGSITRRQTDASA